MKVILINKSCWLWCNYSDDILLFVYVVMVLIDIFFRLLWLKYIVKNVFFIYNLYVVKVLEKDVYIFWCGFF